MTSALAALVLGAVSLHAEPATLTLEKGGTAKVEIQVTGDNGAPAPDAKLSLSTSAGGLSAVESLGGGKFQAKYSPPAERHPNVALITANADVGGHHQLGWLSLPLSARTTLQIDTKPKSSVTVTVAGQSFGPATADAKGRLAMPAVVPPGALEATISATDKAGNVTNKPLDLKQVTLTRVRVASTVPFASWADSEALEVEVFAVGPNGAPLDSPASLHVQAKRGQLDAPVTRGPGVFAYPYHAPEAVGDGKDAVSAALEGSNPASLDVGVKPGHPHHFAVRIVPPTYGAGSGSRVRVTAESVDEKGNPSGQEVPTLTADVGTLEGPATGASLKVPDAFGGRAEVVVRASGGGLTGESKLPLQAGPPAHAELSMSSEKVHAGDVIKSDLTVTDAFGNPVPHATLQAAASNGRNAEIQEVGDGHYTVIYATMISDASERVDFSVKSADATLATSPALTLLPFERAWGFSVGLWAGEYGTEPVGGSGSFTPRVELGLRVSKSDLEILLVGGPNVSLAGQYQYKCAPNCGATPDGNYSKQSGVGYELNAGLRYSLFLTSQMALEAAGLVGVVHESVQPGTPNGLSAGLLSSVSALSLHGGAGLAYWLGNGRLFLHLEDAWAQDHSGQVGGNLLGPGVSLGYVYSL